jgi:[protein-PII] uridylyltransferase
MVRHHLLLADVATRRDLDDPTTVATVAAAVGDRGTLALLRALTASDSLATGPAAWSPWKAGLVDDLVDRVDHVLAGEEAPRRARFPTTAQLAVLERARAAKRLVVEATGHAAIVAAPDRPGLFCQVAGVLALHGLDVLAARAWSIADGMAVEEFQVEPTFGREPDWGAVEADALRALRGELSLEDRLAARARQYAGRPGVRAASPPRTEVAVHPDASDTATVVDVRAPDRIGTLYRLTRVLADLGLDIRHAKVTTVGPEVVDAFYVVDEALGKVSPERTSVIEGALRLVLAGVETGP